MIDQNGFVTVGRSDDNAYTSSQTAELALNEAILRAEIARSYEEYLDVFERFYADDVEVSSEGSRETIRRKAQIRSFLLKFLVPLHVMAEFAGLSISVQQAAVPRDAANEHHYDHQQIGSPLTGDDLNSDLGLGRLRAEFSGALGRK